MRILYNNDGIPFILGEDDTIIDFTPGNQNYIVGELATDTNTMQKLFKDVKASIDKKIKDYSNSPKNNFSEAGSAIDYLRKALQLAYIIDVCNQAEDLHYRIITPKEHETWIWDSNDREWVAPFPIPFGEPGDRYRWSDEYETWVVAKECPHEGWEWNGSVHNWVPPINYPIDAGPEEFVWDDESHTWVLNKES
jgi:hypothetical protein